MKYPNNNSASSGFALVLSLSLMSFILLLILTFIGLTVVEKENASSKLNQFIAKQNALTALHIAISELQLRLGPDQRATASADILDQENSPYTLVWNSNPEKAWDEEENNWSNSGTTENFAFPLISLEKDKLSSIISGTGKFDENLLDDPVDLLQVSNPLSGETISLQGNKISIADEKGMTVGSYAWVAQDQSLKASLSTTYSDYIVKDASGKVVNADSPFALPETSRSLSVFPHSDPSGIKSSEDDSLFGEIDLENNLHHQELKKCITLPDIKSSKIINVPHESVENFDTLLASHFTVGTRGVLSDAKNGGLRKDLTRGLDDEYLSKLHEKPVFGLDENGNRLRFNNKAYPIGDQWKFFRDYYNFYKDLDDGLAQGLGSRNVFLGLNDVTSLNPKTPVRMTNKDVGKHINYLYPSQSFMNGRPETTYNSIINPQVARRVHKTPQATTNDDAWYLFTPALRPVVLRTTFKIGMKSKLDNASGKYVLQFQVYPSMVIWNPFNVTIDLNQQSIANPMAIGSALETHIHGNDRFVISVNGDERVYAIRNGSWAPKVVALYEDMLRKSNLPNSMPAGQVWVLGLDKSYTADVEPIYNTAGPMVYPPEIQNQSDLSTFTGDKVPTASYDNQAVNLQPDTGYGNSTSNLFPLYLAKSSNNVSENNSITYTTKYLMTHDDATLLSGFKKVGRGVRARYIPITVKSAFWEQALFEGSDTIKILKFNKSLGGISKRVTGEYDWTGKLTRAPNSARVEAFHHYENADLRVPPNDENNDIDLGMVGALSSGNAFPFYQIDFVARNSSEEINSGIKNAAFPAFANINFLGTQPLVVQSRDGVGDIKSIYIPQKLAANHALDAIPPRDNQTGKGFYGGSYNSNNSSSRITLYDIPRHPIISIADFKNLTFSWFEDSPARPIGASWPNPTLRELSETFIPVRFGDFKIGAGCDTSYFYNKELFDTYFFSGLYTDAKYSENTFPYGDLIDQDYLDNRLPLANTRLVINDELVLDELLQADSESSYSAFEKTAAKLSIDGVFNINSTSSIAWQSILSGFKNSALLGVSENYDSIVEYDAEGSAFVDNFIPAGDEENLYAGHRRIEDTDLKLLSEKITEVIRTRGVAKNLGEFINRDPNSTDIVEQKLGRLDQAIEASGVNKSKHLIASTTTVQEDIRAVSAGAGQAQLEVNNLANYTGAGLPGYFKQQDILRPLSPIMTSRGDTFIIRAYGDNLNQATGEITSSMVCEATLQRVPEYVDDSDESWETPDANSTNDRFGRKFKIVNFRWIHLDDV